MFLKTSKFICPICGGNLFKTENALKCLKSHSFDISKQGYVNLLMSGSSGRHGDDKLMVAARRSFLEKGYYSPLRDAICKIIGSGHRVLDSGCGEGYYTSAFAENNEVCGIDISKEALKFSAKKCSNSEFAVASINAIPLAQNSVDVITNIFAPVSLTEFSRVLTKDGRYITAIPMENHLFSLKKEVYEKPYLNPAPITDLEGFELIGTKEVKYNFKLENNADICSLFMMTLYYYKTSREDQTKLTEISSLTVEAEFLIAEYRVVKQG